jgi:hypothetical protein
MERHSIFLRDWHANEAAISARIPGNWLVTCGHCGVGLGGARVEPGPSTRIVWRHDQSNWFGTFEVQS